MPEVEVLVAQEVEVGEVPLAVALQAVLEVLGVLEVQEVMNSIGVCVTLLQERSPDVG